MPRRPSEEELKLINKKYVDGDPFTEEDLWVIDYESARSNVQTAYLSFLTPKSIKNFVSDVNGKAAGRSRSVPFYVNHDLTQRLPLGVNFGAGLDGKGDDVGFRHRAFFKKGYSTGDIKADDYVTAVTMSAMPETSVGFMAKKLTCRICHNDIRTSACPHYPGGRYNVGTPDEPKMVVCTYDVDDAHLQEISAVWKAALPGARVLSAGSDGAPMVSGQDIKQFPAGSTLYFPCNGGAIQLFDLGDEGENMTKEELDAQLTAVSETSEEAEVALADTEETTETLATDEPAVDYAAQLAEANEQLQQVKQERDELQAQLADAQAEAASLKLVADKWVQEIKDAIHHATVAVSADTYSKETLDKMLGALSVDELLQYRTDAAKRLSLSVKTGRMTSSEAAGSASELSQYQDPKTFKVGR